jgi:hypothetical protein
MPSWRVMLYTGTAVSFVVLVSFMKNTGNSTVVPEAETSTEGDPFTGMIWPRTESPYPGPSNKTALSAVQ